MADALADDLAETLTPRLHGRSRRPSAALAIGGGLAALLACAPPAPPPEPAPAPAPAPVVEAPAPLPEPVFEPGRTYAVIELGNGEGSDTDRALRAFCDVTILRRYRVRYNRENWPTCSSRELMVGVSRPGEAPETGAVLGDGRRIRVWEVFDLAAGPDAAPLEGRYVLAAKAAEEDTIELFTGRVPVYRIVPGKIHYLGRMDSSGPVAARDIDGFARAFRARFPDVARTRLETSRLGVLEVTCNPALGSTAERINGFDCLGTRGRGRYF